jgi:hypothetical protein
MPLRDLPYEAWLEHAFGHEVRIGRNPWYFDEDHEFWQPTSAEYVGHLTRLFENPEVLVAEFGDGQIAQGLTYLVDTMASGDDGHLADRSVPIADRLRLLRSIATLFERVFAPRCSPHLSHIDEPGAAALNGRCYMWWDTFPSLGYDGDPHLDEMRDAALTVMSRTLSFDSIACQESALHGLGHWHRESAHRVEAIIDAFIASHPDARPELIRYAKAARSAILAQTPQRPLCPT